MMPKPVIKGICIFLAGLMILSIVAVVLQVVAVEPGVVAYATPVTGENDADYIIPIGLGLLAVIAVGVCVFLPKMRKTEEETE